MKLRPRRIKKRCLVLLIILFNLLLVLLVKHKNKMNIGNKVDLGRLKWFGTGTIVVSAMEMFQDVGFSDAISKSELISTDVQGQGDVVDSILSRVNVEVREILLIDTRRLRGMNRTVFPRFEKERANYSLGIDYIEELAKEFIRRIDNGRVKYPFGSNTAREYVMRIKSFTKRHTKGEDDSEIIKLVNKVFPTIEISFYTYIMMVLLNIREMIVEDFDSIKEILKTRKIYSISNDKINQLGGMIMRARAFNDGIPEWNLCNACDQVFFEEDRADLQKLTCDDVICRRCLKQSFLYSDDEFCIKCGTEYDILPGNRFKDLLD
ncbi:uncharacterized protein Eint_091640 [Encephalitozoon intestinalis ATCC 50506]|uniref:RING-type domain-containing protein n=1 Tax=Encephalitozoon intestinalis (strain ATCC 50506) TaxID=876142 RepID=E0S936_ENCIT|nr:uncharacterized protein Eint_091640 [Encephalitozoon intestinalis ATCC 50506]ADM12292.1 hypothetical protein Eint_091640 [Encephalitozoon intestinalis ATCC 50506]UTX46102.1 hypothetical protein GPK93_09g16900 [Encephalitozoon intestinalis]